MSKETEALKAIAKHNRIKAAAPEMLDLIKRSTTLLAESTEANEPRVVVHRDHLIALIKKLDPEYFGG